MNDRELILILGGARGGKSAYAEDLAQELGGDQVVYVATAQALDDEMCDRIAKHRAARPATWRTVEAPSLREPSLADELAGARVVLLDCLTLLTSNALLGEEMSSTQSSPQEAEARVEAEISALLDVYARGTAAWIVVSNEVGLGLVPDNALGRSYRDALGRANQRVAAAADQVLLLIAGLPLQLK